MKGSQQGGGSRPIKLRLSQVFCRDMACREFKPHLLAFPMLPVPKKYLARVSTYQFCCESDGFSCPSHEAAR